MKYLVDNMFNGLAKELTKSDIECETAIHAIWKDDDSAQPGRWDAQIFRFLLEKKFTFIPRASSSEDYTIITADKDLNRYCCEFGIKCMLIPESNSLTKSEYAALAAELVGRLERKT
jgi:predicted nuclease of predicted toxin-antitoxin system